MPGRILEETPTPLLQPQTQPDVMDLGQASFPPVTKEHILHCSYDYWFPKYRTSCIRSRIIRLTPDFVSYLREDGIILADDNDGNTGGVGDEDDDWEPSFDTSAFRPPGRETTAEAADESESESGSGSESNEPTTTRPARLPPNRRFPDLHRAIADAIADLGGAAAPKLNWSSPKDATWISRHPNTMKCTSADDVYMLLKSSSFASHDLDHAFDGTVDAAAAAAAAAATDGAADAAPVPAPVPTTPTPPAAAANGYPATFQPVLVLRAFFSPLPSLEFRCFVKARRLVAISQRDLNYYPFLHRLRAGVAARAAALFAARLRDSFPDPDFVFDVYIPEAAGYDSPASSGNSDNDGDDDDDDEEDGAWDSEGGAEARRRRRAEHQEQARLGRARLIDINPWAPRTDPLLFDWAELLAWKIPAREEPEVVRATFVPASALLGVQLDGGGGAGVSLEDRLRELGLTNGHGGRQNDRGREEGEEEGEEEDDDSDDDDSDEEINDEPEVRLIERDDPAAYYFGSAQYSAHKMPMEVVSASAAGQGGMMEFARRWQRITGDRT